MKIVAINNTFKAQNQKKNKGSQTIPNQKLENNSSSSVALSNYNKAFVSFKGYDGDRQPARRLFWILSGTNDVYENNYIKSNLFENGNTGWKKWVDLPPEDLLKFNPKDSIEALCTLNKQRDCLPGIPAFIPSPNYGDNWGRKANYIEINPRTIAYTQGEMKSEGLLNLIKLLPAIPPSPNSFPNCIVLSQLYPSVYNDGKTGDSSLYTVNLHSGISKNLTSDKLSRNGDKIKDVELVKAFNDLAHYRGFKTGTRMVLSSDQLRVQGQEFNWFRHEQAFIDACCDIVDLGFDSIYFDSAKHVGYYDMGNYQGSGSLPNFQQMQYITKQIRDKTGRNDLSLIGEKCTNDYRFKEMGLNAGTDWSKPDDWESVVYESRRQSHIPEYAAGPDISNDNDLGHLSLDQRRNRVNNALYGYDHVNSKLPSFMQMTDLFPLNPFTNTHLEMLSSKNLSAFGDIESHYNNIFDTSFKAKIYKKIIYKIFSQVMYR